MNGSQRGLMKSQHQKEAGDLCHSVSSVTAYGEVLDQGSKWRDAFHQGLLWDSVSHHGQPMKRGFSLGQHEAAGFSFMDILEEILLMEIAYGEILLIQGSQ